jgi:hypothetical protein
MDSCEQKDELIAAPLGLDMVSETASWTTADAIDGVFEEEDEDQAIEDVVGQVLAEIGMDMSGAMASAPGRTPVAEAEPEGELSLEERLKNLKGWWRRRKCEPKPARA